MEGRVSGSRSIGERLQHATLAAFVGRASECDLFRSALQTSEPPFQLLRILGPSGIGKTTLLRKFAAIANEVGVPAGLIDGRSIEASPDQFIAATNSALGHWPHECRERSSVLIIDSFEALTPLAGWLMHDFLPTLPSGVLVVLASRAGSSAPVPRGWGALVRTVKLRNMAPAESDEFLERRGVPAKARGPILELSHGHPLAMAMAADLIDQTGTLGRVERLEVIAALLDRVIEHAPSADHQLAIEIASHARVTSEALLADAIGPAVASEIFAWLRKLSFMEVGEEGLRPHDLARDTVHADLAWRSLPRLRDVHMRTREHYLRQYREGTSSERHSVLRDLVYLHRLNPIMRSFFEFRAIGHVYAEPATAGDHSEILGLVARFEGQASAAIAKHWLERQPRSFLAMRSAEERLAWVLCQLDLTSVDDTDARVDPVIREAQNIMQRSLPRAGEAAVLGRFLISAASYQGGSAATTAMQIQSYFTWMTTPRLGWSFLTIDRERDWTDLMRYIDFAAAGDEIAEIPPRRFGLFAHDWRKVDPIAWLDMMEHRELETEMRTEDLRPPQSEALVLSEPHFRDAVRHALRHTLDDRALADNPLLRSRFLMKGSTPAKPAALREALRIAAASLEGRPRDDKFYEALDLTFFGPPLTQEAAAERLGLPFGTYRYRLSTAIDRVTDLLWEQELNS